MPSVELEAEAVAAELDAFRHACARGLGTLRRLGDAELGATPREAVLRVDDVVLYRYRDGERPGAGPPLLIVYALVNRPDMIDLEQGRSLVGALMARGFDVWLVDWGRPGAADAALGLDDYVNRYLDACVDHMCASLTRTQVSLLGICQGGTFSTCYAALHPEKVERLVTTVTPIDFHTEEDRLSRLVRHVDVTRLVESFGNVGGDFLNALFLALKPFRLTQQKYLRFLERLDDPAATATFLRMEQWIFDSPALPAMVCHEFATQLYQQNALVRGALAIGGRAVEPQRITMPVLNLFARDDHLVPPAASRALAGIVGTRDYTEAELAGGHIGLYVSLKSARSVPAVVAEWFGLERPG